MAMAEQQFVVKSSIRLCINDKNRTIELLFGDISKLGMRNEVDIVLVSAFPDVYTSTAGTVLESLKSNLKLSVADLAKVKTVDKRKTHKCWWSNIRGRPDVPFDRLLCYESGKSKKRSAAAELTNTVFGCLEDIFHKQPFKMASSLLNTGQQKAERVDMLEAIVGAAITAMKDGLNLEQFMLFVHAEYKGEAAIEPKVPIEGIVTKFEALKIKYQAIYVHSARP